MAQPYYERLTQIIAGLGPRPAVGVTLESRHFFSGAAVYANGKICATLGPAGFALKLPPDERKKLIDEGKGTPFRFFAKGPIKREYVAVSESIIQDEEALRALIGMSARYVVGPPS